MPTQYVMRATLNTTGKTVYWVVTGAADTTGAQSGYNPANLTGITTDYTTTVAATTTGGTTTDAGGWVTALDLDFTQQPTQSLSSDGTYTIAGLTWNKRNSSGDATAMAITNGTGLVITPAQATDFYTSTNTSPQLDILLSDISSNIKMGTSVRLWIYYSSQNAAANYDQALFGLNSHSNSLSMHSVRGNDAGGQIINRILAAGVNYSLQNSVTLDSTNNVVRVDIPAIGNPEITIFTGQYSSGWPDDSSLTLRRYIGNDAVNATGLTPSNASLFISAFRAGSATAYSVTVARIKVEYLATIPQTLGSIVTSDTYANLPTPGVAGRIFLPTDKNLLYRDNGSSWVAFGDRYTPTDSNTIIQWKFTETGSPFANSGTGSTLSLTTFTGTPVKVTGLFGKALGCSGMTLSTGNSSVNESFTNALTVSAWVKPRTYATYGTIVNKAYRNDNSWSTPFVSIYLSITNAGDGSWAPALNVGGTLYQPVQTGAFRIPLYQWTLLAYTFDGSNIRSYVNGALSGTTAASGTIDYGTHGPWDVGGVSNAGVGQQWDGHINDIRIENVVRSQSYLETMYRNGVGLFE